MQTNEWTTLFKDVESAIAEGAEPESAKGLSLADRWADLVAAFTGGHAAIADGVKKVWQDFENLPEPPKEQMRPFKNLASDEINGFISRAMAARNRKP